MATIQLIGLLIFCVHYGAMLRIWFLVTELTRVKARPGADFWRHW